MYSAIGIGMMLLGGWVLPDMAAPTPTLPDAGASATAASPVDEMPELTRPSSRSTRGGVYAPGEPWGSMGPAGMPGGGLGAMGRGSGGLMSPSHIARQFIPPVPTDPEGELPDLSRFMAAPSASSSLGSTSRGTPYAPGSPAARAYAQSRGLSPTAAAARARTQRLSGSAFGRGLENIGQAGISGGSASVAARKPFSGYRPPPAVSPYLNLYRLDSGDEIDNYNTLVRPMEEQRQFNSRLRRDVEGLEEFSQRQRQAMQQLDRRQNIFQGTTDPRFFQNTERYYRGQ